MIKSCACLSCLKSNSEGAPGDHCKMASEEPSDGEAPSELVKHWLGLATPAKIVKLSPTIVIG